MERTDLQHNTDPPTADERDTLRVAIERWAGTLTPFQAAQRLQTAGVAAGPVQNSEDLWRDPQLRTRGAIVEVDHPDMGIVEFPNSPDHMSKTPGHVKSRGPRLGEHSREIVTEWLGLSQHDIQQLVTQGAIWSPDTDEPPGEER